MSKLLEQIRENLGGTSLGFQKDGVFGFTSASRDQNNITNKLGNYKKSLKYGFSLIDENTRTITDTFQLLINPQEIDQEEKFAIQITPTQQGIVVEHQGSVLKKLILSGTTGLKPGVGAGGVNSNGKYRTSQGQTGYQQFHNFRNFLRNYAELKKDSTNSGLKLVFQNIKDNEYFVVEPDTFKTKRDKTNKFLYNYNISFVIVARLSARSDSENLGWFKSLSDASQRATEYLEDAADIIAGSAEILSNVTDNFTDLIFSPLQALNGALVAFNGAKTRVLDIPRREIQQLKNNITNLNKNFSESIGVDTAAYNTIYGVQSTTKNKKSTPTSNDYRLSRALSNAVRGMNIVLSNDDFFGKKDMLNISQDIIKIYDGNLQIPNAQNYRIAKVLEGDSMQTIAARELQTAARFREIIILNQLKAPYIDTVKKQGVLIPGDDVMIPTQNTNNEEPLIIQNQGSVISNKLTFSEQQLGVDLSLNKDFDLEFNNLNDLKLKAGHENAAQAVKIKLGLERLSLKYHPEIGLDIKLGEKLTEEVLSELQDDLRNSILLDPRFDDASFNITVANNIIQIQGFIREKAFQLSTPINLSIQRNT